MVFFIMGILSHLKPGLKQLLASVLKRDAHLDGFLILSTVEILDIPTTRIDTLSRNSAKAFLVWPENKGYNSNKLINKYYF